MSAHIDVRAEESGDGWTVDVTVREGSGSTRHRVRLWRGDYERLSGGKSSPEELVRRSFEFLLKRESKESILSSFDLPLIGRYFPEYESEIRLKP